jgi:alkylmercury lyase
MTRAEVARAVTTSERNRADYAIRLVPVLARVYPTAMEELARAGGWTEDEVTEEVCRQPSIEWDAEGRIVGFGVTLHPTPHRFALDGGTVYGRRASDALTFPLSLNTAGASSRPAR